MRIGFKAHSPSQILRGHLNMGGQSAGSERIDVTSLYIERGGRPWMGVMGEYHYSRDSRANWRAELAKMKAGGVSVVSTYVIWIYHEELEGQADFSGDLDVRAFVLECQRQGLDVMLRIGPWTHGECRNGGFPDWLLQKDFRLRDSNPGYMQTVRVWYERIFEQVKGLFFKDGGPVIGVQLENELIDNAAHLLDLKRLALEIGFEVPLYTVTGWNSPYGARIPVRDVLPVFAAYVEAPWAESLMPQPPCPHFSFDPTVNNTALEFGIPRDCDEDGWRIPYERYPYATCELGGGLQSTHHRRIVVSGMDIYASALVKLGCGNNLPGYYMYHGGTNRIGRLSTLQESRATGYSNDLPILNYDFQACLGQYGQAREHYGLLNMLHLFVADFGDRLAAMEHVPAGEFVPCSDLTHLRCCLRSDGKSAFVFVNHYQRMARIADVLGAQITALDVTFPALDVKGDIAFFLPVHMAIGGAHLRWASAQPLCRAGKTFFFAAIDGIPAQYQLLAADGSVKTVCARAALSGGFEMDGVRVVTLTWEQAKRLRKLSGEVYVGEGCNVYELDGGIHAIEDGSFAYHRWTGEGFERVDVSRPFEQAVLTLTPVDEPFVPPYEKELHLSGPGKRWWQRLSVSSAQGFVAVGGEYDTAQLYADGRLVADHFFDGKAWEIPAALLYGRECYVVMSPLKDDCYLECRTAP